MLLAGEFINDLKISRVKPLFKSGEESSFSKYWPISSIPSFSKIFKYINMIFILRKINNIIIPLVQ